MLKRFLATVFLGAFTLQQSFANVIMATRVVYPANQKSVVFNLTASGETPSLVQVWIDSGDINSNPATTKSPFVITPPISRVDPGKGQTLRITYTGQDLPTDRESIFYLNILDIPPKPTGEKAPANYLQIAIKSRIKLFYRPALDISLYEAFAKVEWSVSKEGKKNYLVVTNPTPYYITYEQIEIVAGNSTVKVPDADMVAPFASVRYEISRAVNANAEVRWVTIDDNGARPQGSSKLK
ncbi:hypothetical protein CKF54_06655 [Psittacicella hinzii]|uniref:Chaperone protein HifB n=1 Tax=Psittacicella hinzii TaxID=2028575 RepID=A0A3A1Y1X8_9GAMM|nr:fimbria/pilus periplasmic chaperone [Psittacicella hinzii]RIY31420.1 hypothetical protein CKF54_06655 [Psittacicella hinzii]